MLQDVTDSLATKSTRDRTMLESDTSVKPVSVITYSERGVYFANTSAPVILFVSFEKL